MTNRSRSRPKLSSIWFCDACKRREVALGLPRKAKCSQCGKPSTFVEAMKPKGTGWPFGRRP
jgi:hypothetical protein